MLGFLTGRGNKEKIAPPVPTVTNKARVPQTTVSLDWLLGLTGELIDDSGASVRFRENIESPNIKLAEVEAWISQSLVQPLEPQRLVALQDLANSIGKRLGFSVTYGKYTKDSSDWLQFDGLWRIDTDLFATVDVYSSRLEGIDFKALEQAALRLKQSNNLLTKCSLLHIFIICDDYDSSVNDEIRRSIFHEDIRLLPISTFFEILKMNTEHVISPSQLPLIFRPFDNIGIHNTMLFLEQFIAGYESQPVNAGLMPGTFVPDLTAANTEDTDETQEAFEHRSALLNTEATFQDIIKMMDNSDGGPELLEEFVGENPENLEAGEYLAALYEALEEPKKALARYEAVLSVAPAREPSLTRAVEILKEDGKYSRALGLVERTLPNIPPSVVALRAQLLLLASKPAECRAVCEEVLMKDVSRPDIYRLMGLAFERESAWSEAMGCFEKAIQLSPSDTESKRRITKLRKQLNYSADE
jgi:tetratricopeptide (TPR) repeat protein